MTESHNPRLETTKRAATILATLGVYDKGVNPNTPDLMRQILYRAYARQMFPALPGEVVIIDFGAGITAARYKPGDVPENAQTWTVDQVRKYGQDLAGTGRTSR